MNIQKLNEAIDGLKRDLGISLLATDIFSTADGTSLAGYNGAPKACALFNELTGDIKSSLAASGYPSLNRYYMLDLKDGHLVLVLDFDEYQWGALIDSKSVRMGLLLSIIIPNARKMFSEALNG